MSTASQPNILMVITHDTGRHLGCYGRNVKTPNFERLAGSAVVFDKHFCPSPSCSPSRMGIQTGTWPHCNGLVGLTHRGFSARGGIKTLPLLLDEAGYETHLFGFQHETNGDPRRLGYRHLHGDPEGHSCKFVEPLVEKFLASRPKKPFFASVGFSETHRPYPEVEKIPDDIEPLDYLPDNEAVRRDTAGLEVLVRRVDSALGKILDSLENNGLLNETLVIYTTDHGIALPRAKATLFEPGVGVALMMKFPGGEHAGKRIEALTQHIDLLPTLCEIAGADIPETTRGQSLIPLIRGETDRLHEEIFLEQTWHAAYDPVRAVRTSGWKYIRAFHERPMYFPPNIDNGYAKDWLRDNGCLETTRPEEQLYDLHADPLEQKNLAGISDYSQEIETLRSKLQAWMEETDDPILKGAVRPDIGATITVPDSYGPADETIRILPDTPID